jgi:hypothetical protein
MITGLRFTTIADPARFSKVKVLYPAPLPDNPWGVLLPLKDTSWGAQIPTVTGEALSHALHGRPKPLRQMLGNPPQARTRKLPLIDKMCFESQASICDMATPNCFPGSGSMPECYGAPVEDRELRKLATAVAKAWEEGRYVFVVEGPEFLVT